MDQVEKGIQTAQRLAATHNRIHYVYESPRHGVGTVSNLRPAVSDYIEVSPDGMSHHRHQEMENN